MEKEHIKAEMRRVETLSDMLTEKVNEFCFYSGNAAGYDFSKNSNKSKTAILNQITTLRNELLVLAEKVKEA